MTTPTNTQSLTEDQRQALIAAGIITENSVIDLPVTGSTTDDAETTQADDTDAVAVDVSEMPPFRDLTKALPSARFAFVSRVQQIAENFGDVKGGEVTIDTSNIESLVGLMEPIEALVLDQAQDRDAMAEWIVDTGGADEDAALELPTQRLFAAFEVLSGTLAKKSTD